jgi:hypothetical protein
MKVNLTIGIRDWLDRICAWPVMVYRLLKYGYTFRRIYLGEGIWTILDQEDYCRLRKFKWVVYGTGHNLYAVRLKLVGPNRTWQISMHREIMRPKKGRLVDHRNCDSLDNRRENLRFATCAENVHNRRKRKNATSQFIDVSFYRPRGNWECRITNRGKRIRIGRFDSEIDAGRAYDKAAKKYFGEFARLNFPDQPQRHKGGDIITTVLRRMGRCSHPFLAGVGS